MRCSSSLCAAASNSFSHSGSIGGAPGRLSTRSTLRRREHDREARRLAGAALEGEIEAVLAEDLLRDRQPESLAVLLRAEEGPEELLACLRRDARPAVLDRDEAALSGSP